MEQCKFHLQYLEFEELNRQQPFSGFLLSQAKRLADMGRTRTSETYISILHSFIKFNNDEDMMLYEITAEVMEDYERYLKNRNLTYYRRKTSGRLDIRSEQQMQRRLHSYTFLRLIPQL